MRGIREGWTRHPWEWLLLLAAIALLVTLAAAPRAHGSFHFMKISEVFPGTAIDPDSAFIELQMFSASQQFVFDQRIDVYDGDSVDHFYDFTGNADFGDNQRTILIGDDNVDNAFGVTPDFIDNGLATVVVAGGAVCYLGAEPIDCVEWGTGTSAVLPNANAGSPVAPAGIPDGQSITRSMTPGCATFLEPGDDTDDSVTDFLVTAPSPRPNSTTPTETACGGGGNGAPIVKCGGLNATKTGNAGANVLVGTAGRDVIAGLGGRDTIRGLAGNDVLCGGGGSDKLVGGGGRDRLLGQAGRDTCKGGPKRDTARTCEIKRTI